MTNVLEYLQQSAERLPLKTAFASPESAITFAQLQNAAKSAGSFFAMHTAPKKPIVFLWINLRFV